MRARVLLATPCLTLLAAGCAATTWNSVAPDDSSPAPRTDRVQRIEQNGRVEATLVDFEPSIRVQETEVWCWAACAEMVHAFNDQRVTQEEIVDRIHGRDADDELRIAAATRYEIMCALNPDMPRREFDLIWEGLRKQLAESPQTRAVPTGITYERAAALEIALERHGPSNGIAIEDLERGHPAVVGLRDSKESRQGHAYVLVGAEWSEQPRLADKLTGAVEGRLPGWGAIVDRFGGAKKVHRVRLIDPFDGTSSDHDWEDVRDRIDFTITVQSARRVLESWHRLIQIETS